MVAIEQCLLNRETMERQVPLIIPPILPIQHLEAARKLEQVAGSVFTEEQAQVLVLQALLKIHPIKFMFVILMEAAVQSGITPRAQPIIQKNQTTSTLSAPTIQATDIVFSDIYSSQMTLGWTLGNGANRVVFAKQTSAGTTTPIDNTTYTASATFGSGTQIGTTAWYCIYNGNGSAAMVTGLAANTDYTFQVFEYNASPGSELYLITTATNNPKTQATNNTDMPNNALSFDRSGDYVKLRKPHRT